MKISAKPGRISLQLAVLLLVALLFSGCSKPVPQQLPADWPIAELTLPEGSVITRPVAKVHELPTNLPGRQWMVFFDNPGTFTEVAAHMESDLATVGYRKLLLGDQKDDSDVPLRDYYSQDGKVCVNLGEGMTTASALQKGFNSDYMLTIMESEEPTPFLKAVEMGKARWVDLK